MAKIVFRLLISLIIIGFISISYADVVVIASPDFAVKSISNSKLKKLWLGKTKKISALGRVYISDQDHEKPTAILFYQRIIKKTPAQVRAYWAKIQFIGKGFPPKRFADDAAIIEWVKQGSNRIGYIDEKSVTDEFIILNKITGDKNVKQ